MSEQEQMDPGTFDLGEWVQGHSTYPRFTATVYLDRDAAAQAVEIKREIDKLRKQKSKDSDEANAWSSIADAQMLPENQILELEERHQELMRKLKSSETKLVFGVKERNVDKRINDKLRDEFEQLKGVSDRKLMEMVAEDEEIAARRSALQLKETIVEITNAKGQKANLAKLTPDALKDFVEGLTNRDLGKVFSNMQQAITGGNVVDEAVDAGFPR